MRTIDLSSRATSAEDEGSRHEGNRRYRSDDKSENDEVDSSMLAEVAGDRVDILITEDRGIHRKAARLGLAGRVFTIDAFLERSPPKIRPLPTTRFFQSSRCCSGP